MIDAPASKSVDLLLGNPSTCAQKNTVEKIHDSVQSRSEALNCRNSVIIRNPLHSAELKNFRWSVKEHYTCHIELINSARLAQVQAKNNLIQKLQNQLSERDSKINQLTRRIKVLEDELSGDHQSTASQPDKTMQKSKLVSLNTFTNTTAAVGVSMNDSFADQDTDGSFNEGEQTMIEIEPNSATEKDILQSWDAGARKEKFNRQIGRILDKGDLKGINQTWRQS